MKKILLLLSFVIAAGCSRAQQKQPDIQNIPTFKMLTADSTWFTSAELKKHKPVMIIYFSPDCSHCQHLMYEMKPYMKQLSNIQIVMVTFTQFNMLQMIQNFRRDFDLAKYHNVTIGTEGHTYVVQRYYQVRMTPYIAIYDKKGKLVKAYEQAPTMNELVATVKKA
ncbi:MAG TPA: thioredoxin fold domain-containing protein [Mucilaginibacter sp.]|nr:thioredoxin fold domain-containing protein [Mucilaginibacter sp.]